MTTKAKFSDIDDYIKSQPEEIRAGLKLLRTTIKNAAPEAEEVISYNMPGFKLNGILVWFAGTKNHYGLYPMPNTIKFFKDSLKNYEVSKGTIRFPIGKKIPLKLVTDIVKFRVKENLKKKKKK
jgi:uncharacterized protein YdhG (YjbR/CyaY superfamily)